MKVGDLVRINRDKEKIVFRITKITNGTATLKGEVIRLICEAPITELIRTEERSISDESSKLSNMNVQNYKGILKGVILHIDGDPRYLEKAMKAYKDFGIQAIGYHIEESTIPLRITELLMTHHPDILIITGHDALENPRLNDENAYRNSKYFIQAIDLARKYEKSKDELIIIAGACQSYYEALMRVGANFASSPNRENIHLLDPVIIASQIAVTNIQDYINVEETIGKTISQSLGGIETRGVARRVYQKGNMT